MDERIDVNELLFDLTSEIADVRKSAVSLLGKYGNAEVIPEIKKLMDDPDVSVRYFAKRAFGEITGRHPKVVKPAPVIGDYTPEQMKKAFTLDAESRLAAIQRSFSYDDPAYYPVLKEQLEKETHKFCIASLVKAVGRFRVADSLDLILRFTQDEDARVRANTVEALDFFRNEKTAQSLILLLDDSDNRVRANAAKALAKFRDRLDLVYAAIEQMIVSDKVWMKDSAIYVLSELKTERAIEILYRLGKSESSNQYIYEKVRDALKKIGQKNPAALEIIEKIRVKTQSDLHFSIDGKSFSELKNIYSILGPEQRMSVVSQMLERGESSSDRFVEDVLATETDEKIILLAEKELTIRRKGVADKAVDSFEKFIQMFDSQSFRDRVAAVMNAHKFDREKTYEMLLKKLKTERHPFVVATLVKAIGQSAQESAVDIIIPYLNNSDNRIRANAIEGLGYIGSEKAIAQVEPFIDDENNRVRANAISVLSRYKKGQAFAALKKMVLSPSEVLNKSAIYAVGEMSTDNIIEFFDALIYAKDDEIKLKIITLFEEVGKRNKIARELIEKYNQGEHRVPTVKSLIDNYNKTSIPSRKISVINEISRFESDDAYEFLKKVTKSETGETAALAGSYLESISLTKKKEALLSKTGQSVLDMSDSLKDISSMVDEIVRRIHSIDGEMEKGSNVLDLIWKRKACIRQLGVEAFSLYRQKQLTSSRLCALCSEIETAEQMLSSPVKKDSEKPESYPETPDILKPPETVKKRCLICGFTANPENAEKCISCGAVIKRKVHVPVTPVSENIYSSEKFKKYLWVVGAAFILIVIFSLYSVITGTRVGEEYTESLQDTESLRYMVRRASSEEISGKPVKWEGIIETYDKNKRLLKLRRGEYFFYAEADSNPYFIQGRRVMIKGKVKKKTDDGQILVNAETIYEIK